MTSEAYKEHIEKLWDQSRDTAVLESWADEPKSEERRVLRRKAIEESGFLNGSSKSEDIQIVFTPDVEWEL